MQDAQQTILGDAPDFHRVESPLGEYFEHFLLAAALGHEQHALLRFAEHHFVRRHAGFALRHARQFDLDAQAAARGHFARRAREPRGAHVLNRDDRAGVHRFEARLQQQLFHERIAHLHVGPLLLRLFREFRGREQRCAVNAVAPGFRADVNDGIAHAARLREKQIFLFRDAQRQNVDERDWRNSPARIALRRRRSARRNSCRSARSRARRRRESAGCARSFRRRLRQGLKPRSVERADRTRLKPRPSKARRMRASGSSRRSGCGWTRQNLRALWDAALAAAVRPRFLEGFSP